MASLADIMVQSQMQATDPNAGPDIAGHIVQGAQLAMQQQELQMKQQQLIQQKQQLHDAKLEKFAQAVEKGQQYTGKAQSNYYNQFLPSYLSSLGLDGEIPKEALQHVTASPETLAKANTIFSDIRAGRVDASSGMKTLFDPMALADVPGTPSGYTLADAVPGAQASALKAQDEYLKDQATVGKQTATFAHEDAKDEATFHKDIANKIGTDLHPLVADKAHINSALDAGNRINDAIAAGKTPNGQDVTLLATGLATTISKRINPTEFENIMHAPGAENWAKDKWVKYIQGGANMTTVNALMSAAKSTNSQLDQEIGAVTNRISSEVNTSRYANNAKTHLAPMYAELGAVPKPAPRPKAKAAAAPQVSVDNTAPAIQATTNVQLKSGISAPLNKIKAYVQSGSVDGSTQSKINEVGLKLGKSAAQVKAMLGL